MPSSRSSRLIRTGSTACTRTPSPTRSLTRAGDWFTVQLASDDDGVTVPDLVRDLVGRGVRVHAVEPVRISIEERLLGILRHDEPEATS